MYYGFILRSSLSKKYNMRFKSSLIQAQNLINCGLNMAQKNISAAIHGPTGTEVMKDIDLSGKTCLVTGANSGIGLEVTRCLTARGAAVLMACRNKYAATSAMNLCDDKQALRFYEINLASLKSVKKCSNEILKEEKKLDIVILNAGVFGLPWTLTEDMLETTFQVNYLSQFLLLLNIECILAPDARVVFMSSESHRHVTWSIEDQMLPHEELVSLPRNEYTSIKAYNISKLCGLLSMHYLGHRWARTMKRVYCAHPGSFVKTRLCRNWWPYEALYTLMLPFSKTISEAASTPLYCATSPHVEGITATYFKDCRRCEESDLAKGFHLAFRIFDLSRELLTERDETLALPDSTKEPVTSDKMADHNALDPDYST